MWRAGRRSCGSLAQGPIEARSLRSAFLQRLAAQLDGREFGDGELRRRYLADDTQSKWVTREVRLARGCAASARVNVSVLYQPLTPPTGLGLLASLPRRGFSRSGSAWLGRSQKDGLPSLPRGEAFAFAVQGHRLALEGQPGRCPFLAGSGNGRQDARPCFARRPVALLQRRRLDFRLPCFGFGL